MRNGFKFLVEGFTIDIFSYTNVPFPKAFSLQPLYAVSLFGMDSVLKHQSWVHQHLKNNLVVVD